ncbi:cryptochrome/photolyase family protein [Polycladidibacter stylochi]|uniref:cryptochrome/photolyase family protein n=1 Tax=Polycladidibacter stylochi TaxID=1807766 RepID=UPI000835120D|nr:cryptochrome/photolyase family protein [Pseudovibrio stylochi]
MKTLRLILGDQLSRQISSLRDISADTDCVLICEVWEEARYVQHHKKKIAFLFSAMRHFAQELRQAGITVLYTKLDDAENTGSLQREVQRALQQHPFERVIVTMPGEYRLSDIISSWQDNFGVAVEQREDDRFLCTPQEFADWSKERKQLRMEYFYRDMRRRYNVLMNGNKPVGGKWNYDQQNRNPAKPDLTIPQAFSAPIDAITQEVLKLVEQKFSAHFGDLQPFYFAVTRDDAIKVLHQFIQERLVSFGDYQDAMVQGEPWLFHAHISFYLNCGLLLPLECVHAAEQAFYNNQAPLNAVEGFIRQILGWREFIRGIYWLKMPEYAHCNHLNAKAPLPDFYWTGKTSMNCLRQCVLETKQNAYAHHIQRLMVLGNFALLTGVAPKHVNNWFLSVYADAYEWVELPNVNGMVLFADGGLVASKPYAAGGSYINKMSNYCKECAYKVAQKSGEHACPFNYLYWDFLARNRTKLENNPRINMMYKSYDRMGEEKHKNIAKMSSRFLQNL